MRTEIGSCDGQNGDSSKGIEIPKYQSPVVVLEQVNLNTQLVRFPDGTEAYRSTPFAKLRELERLLDQQTKANQTPTLAWEGSS